MPFWFILAGYLTFCYPLTYCDVSPFLSYTPSISWVCLSSLHIGSYHWCLKDDSTTYCHWTTFQMSILPHTSVSGKQIVQLKLIHDKAYLVNKKQKAQFLKKIISNFIWIFWAGDKQWVRQYLILPIPYFPPIVSNFMTEKNIQAAKLLLLLLLMMAHIFACSFQLHIQTHHAIPIWSKQC